MDKKLILFGEEHGSIANANMESDLILAERPKYILHEETLSDIVRTSAEFVEGEMEDCDIEFDRTKGLLYYLTRVGQSDRERFMAQRAIETYMKTSGNVIEIVGAGHLVGDSEILKMLDASGIPYKVMMSERSRLMSSLIRGPVTFFADVLYKIKHG